MPLIKCQVHLPYASGIPRDQVVHTLYFSSVGALTTAVATEIVARCNNLYGNVGPYMSAYLQRATGAVDIKLFDMSDPEPRAPFEPGWSILLPAASTTTSLPFEVCLCLSYTPQATGTTLPRKRGRIYIGPLVSSASSGGTGSTVPRPTSAVLEAWCDGASGLATVISLASVTWVQYSPTAATDEIVRRAWVDDEFDTQRRRGVDATTRQERAIP